MFPQIYYTYQYPWSNEQLANATATIDMSLWDKWYSDNGLFGQAYTAPYCSLTLQQVCSNRLSRYVSHHA